VRRSVIMPFATTCEAPDNTIRLVSTPSTDEPASDLHNGSGMRHFASIAAVFRILSRHLFMTVHFQKEGPECFMQPLE
jgi:hypothetical protein